MGRAAGSISAPARLRFDPGGFRLTKIGANQFSLVNANVTSGNIDVTAGTLSIEAAANIKGTGAINVGSGAILALWSNTAGAQTRTVTLANGAAITELGSSNPAATFSSPIVLAGMCQRQRQSRHQYPAVAAQRGSGGFGRVRDHSKSDRPANLGVSNFTGPLTVNAGNLTLIGGPNLLATRQIAMGDGGGFRPVGRRLHPAGGRTMTAGRTTAPATDINSALTLSPGSTFSAWAP